METVDKQWSLAVDGNLYDTKFNIITKKTNATMKTNKQFVTMETDQQLIAIET